jgi:CRP-like cAMP-binding protein
MRIQPTAPNGNLLLAALPGRYRRQLLAGGEQVQLASADVLHQPGGRIGHIYFPSDCIISMMTPGHGNHRLEVGLVGDEGMLGTSLVLGVDAARTLAVVQRAGPAWRIDTRRFCLELADSVPLQRSLKRYIYVLMCQLAQTSACTRFHVVEERLARWLLMTRDRAHSSEFHVTHEFLAGMLGVRRAGVTRAASSLQKRKLIRYSRGDVVVTNRTGLESAACACYALDRATYANIMQ